MADFLGTFPKSLESQNSVLDFCFFSFLYKEKVGHLLPFSLEDMLSVGLWHEENTIANSAFYLAKNAIFNFGEDTAAAQTALIGLFRHPMVRRQCLARSILWDWIAVSEDKGTHLLHFLTEDFNTSEGVQMVSAAGCIAVLCAEDEHLKLYLVLMQLQFSSQSQVKFYFS
jgi:hypothetical protein